MVERTLISLPSQLQLIERLQHLIYLSSSLIFVSGESGAGKSTLTENLSNILPSDLQQVYISFSTAPTVEKLRQQIVTQLYDKPLFNAEDKLLTTIERLQKTKDICKNTLIIIDNADNLPPSFVSELCELFLDPSLTQDNTFNVLLLADEVKNQVHLTYIEENLIASAQVLLNHVELKIPALSSREGSALLQHNFEQVGYKAELQHQDALNQQLKSCNGNPQSIIKLADDLSQGALKYEKISWMKTRLPAILLMLFFISIVTALAIYLYPKFLPTKISTQAIDAKIIESDADNFIKEKLSQGIESAQKEALAGSWAVTETEIFDNQNQVGSSDETEKRIVISNNELIELTVLANKFKKEPENASQAQATHQSSHNTLQIQQETYDENPLLVIDRPEIDRENGTDVGPANLKENIESSINLNVVPSINRPLVEAQSDSDSIGITTEENPHQLTNSEELLLKDANNFTLQLSGMASEETLTLFKVKHNLPQKNVFIYQTVRNNKAWFVVIYGEYTSFERASLAAKDLPSTFKNMPTWIKKWQVVHNDLRLNNE